MRIRLNGETLEVARGTTVGSLVDRAVPDRSRVAVERNRAILPRSEYDRHEVAEGDELEIVTLVGGG
ncbi:MAG: sulfur carrier protein ThiS [Planctomycetaceae bacterium]